ncbi:hypothetical protein EVAR_61269_1 [Eumeta japonica]|uniref:Uncharacterized protein n=1 Tax=Eumeta variegata TaxID=151549 RepID=A0A4C1Z871_EUMVA|nr:hypothetical protein EVAR_61269_1 [Eumeta japonica]
MLVCPETLRVLVGVGGIESRKDRKVERILGFWGEKNKNRFPGQGMRWEDLFGSPSVNQGALSLAAVTTSVARCPSQEVSRLSAKSIFHNSNTSTSKLSSWQLERTPDEADERQQGKEAKD